MPRDDYKLSKIPNAPLLQNEALSAQWRRWFEDLFNMVGTPNNYTTSNWAPTITGLTGDYDIDNGVLFKFRKTLHFSLLLNPSPSFSSTLGTSKITGLPSVAVGYGECHVFNDSTKALLGHGYIRKGESDVYLPTWASTNSNVSVTGFVLIDG